MQKLYLIVVFGLLISTALGMSFRNKRQSDLDELIKQTQALNQSQIPNQLDQAQQQKRQTNSNDARALQDSITNQPQTSNQSQTQQNQAQQQSQQTNSTNASATQAQITNQTQTTNQSQTPTQLDQAQQQSQQTNSTDANATQLRQLQTLVYQSCLTVCPVTSEYNPVCGSDGVTYTNPGRLICAQNCGMKITQTRTSRCVTAASSTSTVV